MPGKYLCAAILALTLLAPATSQAAPPPPLEAYGDLPAVEDMALSPTGENVAIAGTMNGERLLLMLDDELNVLKKVTLGDTKLSNIQWIGERGVLLTVTDTEDLGNGFTAEQYEAVYTHMLWLDPEREDQAVFIQNRDIVDSIFGSFGLRKLDGVWTGFFGGIELEFGTIGRYIPTTKPTLFSVDMEKNSPRRIERPAADNTWRDWLVDGEGRVAATFDIDSRSGVWALFGPDGDELAVGQQRQGSAGLTSFGKDGSTVLFWQREENEDFIRRFEAPLDGSAPAKEVFADADLDRLFIDKASGRLLGYRDDGKNTRRVLFNPAHQDAVTKLEKTFAGLRITIVDWTPDFNRMVVRTNGNGDSGTWYLIDIAEASAKDLGKERPAIPAAKVGLITSVQYKAADGLDLDGVLTLPPGTKMDKLAEKPLPIIVLPHGGPNARDEPNFDWWAQAFASRGYTVFQPNFRGSTDRGAAFQAAGKGEWGGKMLSDMSDGLAVLASAGYVDADRACIMGGSYGGYAALAGVTVQQGLYKCAVAFAPVSDLELMYSQDIRESGRSAVVRRALKNTLGPDTDLDAISPRKLAGRADAPILLIHGKNDTVVDFNHSEKMADALDDAGKPYEFVVLEEEDHHLSRAATRKQMLSAAMAFVQKYNPAD